ncbi:MAG: hypothetical protein ABSG87_01395, partial [Verrucomicrobiota bacterium]
MRSWSYFHAKARGAQREFIVAAVCDRRPALTERRYNIRSGFILARRNCFAKIHLEIMQFKERTIMALADMICGNSKPGEKGFFVYRSSSVLTRFFRDCDTDYCHDGSTRNYWVAGAL